MTSLPGPSTKYDPRTLTTAEEHVDTAHSNVIGPSDVADQWGDKGGKTVRTEVLNAWIGTGKRKSLRRMGRRANEDDGAVLKNDTGDHGLEVGPSRVASSSGKPPTTPKRFRRNDDSDGSSDSGGSDDHARTAWKLFGIEEQDDACKTWSSPLSQSHSQILPEAVVDMRTPPTPTSSPLLRERQLRWNNKGKERAIEHASDSGLPLTTPVNPSLERTPTEIVLPPVKPDPSGLTSFLSGRTSPFVSFDDTRFSGQPLEEQQNKAVGSDSQPFACLDNVVLSDLSQDLVAFHPLTQRQSQSQPMPRLHERSVSIIQNVGSVHTMADMENVGEAPPAKRRRIDREESKIKVGEKDNMLDLVGGEVENTHSTPCGRDETCELSYKSFTGLTRTPTLPSVMNKDGKEASLPPTSSALKMEGASEVFSQSSPAPTATISFPVRKRIEDRANYVGKTASVSGRGVSSPRTSRQLRPGLAPCSTSAIVRGPVLAVERTSTIIETSAATLNASGAPVSPRTAVRRAERAERRRITERLRLARPDLVERAQASRRDSQAGLERTTASTTVFTSTSPSAYGMHMGRREASVENEMNVTEEDANMDWDKSHRLAEKVREAVKRGESPSTVLPRLGCLKRWYAEQA